VYRYSGWSNEEFGNGWRWRAVSTSWSCGCFILCQVEPVRVPFSRSCHGPCRMRVENDTFRQWYRHLQLPSHCGSAVGPAICHTIAWIWWQRCMLVDLLWQLNAGLWNCSAVEDLPVSGCTHADLIAPYHTHAVLYQIGILSWNCWSHSVSCDTGLCVPQFLCTGQVNAPFPGVSSNC